MDLKTMDRDGALEEALDGMTRARMFRAAATGAAGAAALAGITAPTASAARKTDLTVLQLALVLERLGVAFYREALREADLSGDTRRFAKTVLRDERDHVAFVSQTIKSLGGAPAPAPAFDFGNVTSSAPRFRAAAAKLEEVCVEALNGAGPLVSKAVLAGAGQLVSVEARHVAWIRHINDDQPARLTFDNALTANQVVRKVNATGFVQGGL